MLYATIAGIAMPNPTSVVHSAWEIPTARSAGFGEVAELAISLKLAIIPVTVPERPIIGATEPINAR